jgi:hypothetical protein
VQSTLILLDLILQAFPALVDSIYQSCEQKTTHLRVILVGVQHCFTLSHEGCTPCRRI